MFAPANLLREARRQRCLADIAVPAVDLLDPDGDIVRYLAGQRPRRHPGSARCHTEMSTVDLDGIEIGVVGMAVGAPFAVLVAELLTASGAELILSITSAGQISAVDELPCFVLIERRCSGGHRRERATRLHSLLVTRLHVADAAGRRPGRLCRVPDRQPRHCAKKMYRYNPAILLYAPLRTAIVEDADGATWFSVDQPRTRFGSFNTPQITKVGIELDLELAALLEYLNAPVPTALT